MAELDDERIRFYLRHRDQIEAWAGLRAETGVAIDALLERLSDEVEGLVTELGDDVVLTPTIDGDAYPRFLLQRDGWGCGPAGPRVAVTLEWVRGKTFLAGTASPYVGVRFALTDDATRLVRNDFRDATQTIRSRRSDKATPWWPCLGYVPADGPFWDDFDAYREKLMRALRSAWEEYAGAVDEVLRAERERVGQG